MSAVSFSHYYFVKFPKEPDFSDELSDILNYIETSTGDPKSVYFQVRSATYMYYLISSLESPYDYDMSRENAEDTYWKFVFHFPDEIDPDNYIYIVKNTDEDFINRLNEYSFECYESGMYRVYYNK